MTNEDKQAVSLVDRFFASFYILQTNGFQFIGSDHFGDDSVQNKIDLGMFLCPILQDAPARNSSRRWMIVTVEA